MNATNNTLSARVPQANARGRGFWDIVGVFDTALGKVFLLPLMLGLALAIAVRLGTSSPMVRHFIWSVLTIVSTTAISIYSIAIVSVHWLAVHPIILLALALAQAFFIASVARALWSFARKRQTVVIKTYGLLPVCQIPFYNWRGKPISWKRIRKVSLTNDGQLHLNFALDNAEVMTMPLLPSLTQRRELLETIRDRAPWAKIDRSLIQQLAPDRFHSYTEIWLDSLGQTSMRRNSSRLECDSLLQDGQYRIIRQIGAGGQGVAYLAETVDLALLPTKHSPKFKKRSSGLKTRRVVLKEFMLPSCSSMKARNDAMDRLNNEALLLVDLVHPQMVRLEDFFVEDHRAYLVIEHVEGTSLRELVGELGALPEEQTRELALQMCKILDYLHGQSPVVVHRDFTPENLIMEHNGTLRLIDFNLAQQSDCSDSPMIVGKPSYMPPEQVKGRALHQSDIYALGATIYFLLTGADPEPLSQSHPRAANDAISSEMDRIVANCTAQELSKRYLSVRSAQVDLCSLNLAIQPLTLDRPIDRASGHCRALREPL